MQKRIFSNKKLQAFIRLNLTACFMVCIFAPLDIYAANAHEFWFSLTQLMKVCMPVFAVSFTVLCLIAVAVCKTKAIDGIYTVCLALFFFFFIQGNFIPRNYGLLQGQDIDWSAYPAYAAAGILLGIFCTAAAVLLYRKFRTRLYFIGNGISLLALCMLAGTALILLLRTDFPSREKAAIVTDSDLLTLSADRNVIVLLADAYDSSYLAHWLETEPEQTAELFEDFTYYRDTLGLYNMTDASVPFILTGKMYLNEEPYQEFIRNASIDDRIHEAFSENGFESNIYTHAEYINPESHYFSNVHEGSYEISDYPAFAACLFRLIAFDYMPHSLKRFFPVDSAQFSQWKQAGSAGEIFNWSTIDFARRLSRQGLTAGKEGKLVKFYHFEGCHTPFTFGADLKEDKKAYTGFDEAAGNNVMLRMYLDALKTAGLYDTSTIVIMADHGGGDDKERQNPVFLIKNADERHPLIVSDAPMSYEYLPQIWEAFARGEAVDEERIRSFTPQYGKRRFILYHWERSVPKAYMGTMMEMFCEGPAYELSSMVPTGKIFSAGEKNDAYILGKTLHFDTTREYTGNAYIHMRYGNGYSNYPGMYLCKNALMSFSLTEDFEDLQVDITFAEPADWDFRILANEEPIETVKKDPERNAVRFLIPGSAIPDGQLELHFYENDAENMEDAFIESGVMLRTLRITAISDMPGDSD